MRGRHARYRPGGHLRVGEVVLVVGAGRARLIASRYRVNGLVS